MDYVMIGLKVAVVVTLLFGVLGAALFNTALDRPRERDPAPLAVWYERLVNNSLKGMFFGALLSLNIALYVAGVVFVLL